MHTPEGHARTHTRTQKHALTHQPTHTQAHTQTHTHTHTYEAINLFEEVTVLLFALILYAGYILYIEKNSGCMELHTTIPTA